MYLRYTDGLEGLSHDLRTVIHSEDNIGNTSSGKSLDLVLNHRFVGEFNKWLGVGKGLRWALVVPLQ